MSALKVLKTLLIQPYPAADVAKLDFYVELVEGMVLVEAGANGFWRLKKVKPSNLMTMTQAIDCWFKDKPLGLEEAVEVSLVEICDFCDKEEVVSILKEFQRKPMQLKHFMGLALQHPAELRGKPIFELGTVGKGKTVLMSHGFDVDGWELANTAFVVTKTGIFVSGCKFGAVRVSAK